MYQFVSWGSAVWISAWKNKAKTEKAIHAVQVMPDSRTVYINGDALFKFVANRKRDLSSGALPSSLNRSVRQ